MKRDTFIIVVISIFSIAPIFGQEVQVQDTLKIQEKLEKIEVTKGFSPKYRFSKSRKRIYTKSELEKCILSVNDDEATRLFRKSNTLGSTATPFAYLGGGLLGWSLGGLGFGEKFDVKIFGAGCFFSALSIFLGYQADRVRIRSVERYDKVLEDQYGITMLNSEINNFSLRLTYSF